MKNNLVKFLTPEKLSFPLSRIKGDILFLRFFTILSLAFICGFCFILGKIILIISNIWELQHPEFSRGFGVLGFWGGDHVPLRI
jgi:hypothetical protein